ncbi:oxidoreductase [Pseudoxanthomonas dokdonensis]|uniref:Oxidoreductase n=1 Tax=Pseudoxanthomonas dokdonensis TaxID=344882 RepID=A0A0R0CK60_9GAMM|nr:oxidoreductase [Pseudoxanthomonas dokdonensis]KRG69989.1 oxidoreductase [Pseudoxanthomonas dokdonensis]
MDTPLKVALLGYGFAGRVFHAPLIAHSHGLQLHCIGSSQTRLVEADWPGVHVRTVEQAIADPEVDLVVVATPNDTHAPLAIRALRHGKHVVVDKPFALDVAEAGAMIDAAQQAGRVLSVFHNRRWDSDFLSARALVESGVLGEIAEFHSHFDRFRPQVGDRWRERDEAGAGLWFDLGPHLLDQALQLFGMPQAILVDIARQRQPDQAPDYFHASLRYPRLRVLLHAGSLVHANALRMAVHGRAGSYLKYGMDTQENQLRAGILPGSAGWGVDSQPGSVIRQQDDGRQSHPAAAVPGDYRQFYSGLADAIASGDAPPVTAQQALQVMRLIELGQQSADQRREIAVA